MQVHASVLVHRFCIQQPGGLPPARDQDGTWARHTMRARPCQHRVALGGHVPFCLFGEAMYVERSLSTVAGSIATMPSRRLTSSHGTNMISTPT